MMAKTTAPAEPLKVSKAAALKMFHDLGLKQVDKWTDQRLAQKISKLADAVDEDTEVEDPDSAKLLKRILKAMEAGTKITLTSDKAAASPAKGNGKVGKKPAKTEEPEEEEDEEEEDTDEADEEESEEEDEEEDTEDDEESEDEEEEETPKKKPGKKPAKKGGAKGRVATDAGAGKRPGIIQTLINRLKKASAKKPVTKADMLEELKEAFPDRDEKAMKSTINSQVPSGLKAEKKILVQRNEQGYWIEDSKGY